MDGFGNYPREKFDPFSVMLFKGLQVVAFLFFIAVLVMNPEAKSGKVDTKAEFLITASWPDGHPDDVDLYAEDPAGNIVWYHVREAGFMVLDRDDRGGLNNTIVVGGKPALPCQSPSKSRRSIPCSRSCTTIRCCSNAPGRSGPRCAFASPTTAASSTSTVAKNRSFS